MVETVWHQIESLAGTIAAAIVTGLDAGGAGSGKAGLPRTMDGKRPEPRSQGTGRKKGRRPFQGAGDEQEIKAAMK